MKHLKSILVFILIMALCASLFTVAYAKPSGGEVDDKDVKNSVLSSDVKTLVDLGLLVGTGKDGVTYEYSKSKPTRIQAFIVYLRLTNQLSNFEQFTYHHGDKNFDDYKGYSEWVQKGMAFAKANPQYNWIGSNGKFNPMAHLTAREYAKVLLTVLGYTVNKDFTWSTVESFAEKIGLDVPEGAFTFEEFATMTVQALKLMGKIIPSPDNAAPTVTDLVLSTPYKEGPPVVNGQVIIYFSEAMNKDTLKNRSNYFIDLDGAGVNPGQALSLINHSAAVPAPDGKSVTLTIPDSALKGGITTITTSGVTDLTGNVIVPDTRVVRISNVLTAQQSVAIAQDKLQITFSNPMTTIIPADFKVYVSGGTTPISEGKGYTLDSSGKIVTITLNNSLTSDAKDPVTKAAALLTIGPNTKDIFGNAVSGDIAATPAKEIILDKIAPVIIARETQDLDTDGHLDAIKLTFNKNIKDSTVVASDFSVSGYAIETYVTIDTADNNVIYLKLTELSAGDTGAKPTIAYKQGSLEDLAGNDLATTATVVTIDKAAPAVIKWLPVGKLTAGGTPSSAVLEVSEELSGDNKTAVRNAVYAKIVPTDLPSTNISWTYDWTSSTQLTVSIAASVNIGADPDYLELSVAKATLIDKVGNTTVSDVVLNK